MSAADPPLVVLTCERCRAERLHQVEYVGHLLLATHCAACGLEIRPRRPSIRREYTQQLEERILTKPRRMLEALKADPRGYVRHLPAAVLTKPCRLGGEWVALHQALQHSTATTRMAAGVHGASVTGRS